MSGESAKRAFLKENGFYFSAPKGKSMRPFIRGGEDVVQVLPPDGDVPNLSVVLFERKNGKTVMHRVVGRKNGAYLVRGDNCYYTERVLPQQILGTAYQIRRKDGTIVSDSDKGRRFLVRLWVYSYPIRYPWGLARRAVRKIIRKIGKR